MEDFRHGNVIKKWLEPGDLGIKGDPKTAMAGTKRMQERPVGFLGEVEIEGTGWRPILNKLDQASDANEAGIRPVLLRRSHGRGGGGCGGLVGGGSSRSRVSRRSGWH